MNFTFWFLFVLFSIGGALFLSGALLAALLVWVWMRERLNKCKCEIGRIEREKKEEEEIASNLDGFNEKMQEKIDERKRKIIEKLKEKQSIQTGEVADMLDVSGRTALRHLSELETEGKVVQTEETGRSSAYKLVK